VEIKMFFTSKKSKQVRNTIVPGITPSLWKGVKKAKDVNKSCLPKINV
jgi:hypothetical protein